MPYLLSSVFRCFKCISVFTLTASKCNFARESALKMVFREQKWASINHGRNMDETWTFHGQLASSLAAQRLRHALSRKRCAARSIGVHERPWHINIPKSHFYELIL